MEFLQKLVKKILSLVAHTALTVAGFFVMLLSLGGFLTGEILGGGIILAIGVAMTAIGTRSLWYPSYKEKQEEKKKLQDIRHTTLEKSNPAAPVSDFVRDSYEKAISDYNSLNGIIRQLQDQELAEQLKKMQGIAQRMINYMREHAEKISMADQFINYYQDRALSLSRQFLEFEQMGLNTPEIAEIKAKTKRTLESFDEAYEAQFSRMLTDKMLEVESELKVAEQIMSDAGIQNTPDALHGRSASHNTAAAGATVTPDMQASASGTDIPDIMLKNNPFSIDRPFDIGGTADEYPCQNRRTGKCRPRGRFQK
ncbi:5-bromo-4-chloroindolyl phosphate hydrolysis family protein [Anaerovibrio sp.]|uniref:5-bromo-4-chloroindolyl phosphate hydrolysis family protein n=1 Tax=Anaerovibrio sp. TaxID=1872532 RepID=UPI003F159BE4